MRDLSLLESKIRNSYARQIYCDAVTSFNSRAYRAAILTTWFSVFVDLLKKIEYMNNNKANKLQKKIKDIQTNPNNSERIKKSLEMEREIISEAKNLALINKDGEDFLIELRNYRHKCAHPTVSDESYVFEPTEEQVRYLITGAVDHCLSLNSLPKNNRIKEFLQKDLVEDFPLQEDLSKFYKDKYVEGIPENTQRQLIKLIMSCAVNPPTKDKLLQDNFEVNDPNISDVISKRCVQLINAIYYNISRKILVDMFEDQSEKLMEKNIYRFIGVFSSFGFFKDNLTEAQFCKCKAKYQNAKENNSKNSWELFLNGLPNDSDLKRESEKLFNSEFFLKDRDNLSKLVKSEFPDASLLIDKCMSKLKNSGSYIDADYYAELLIELASSFKENNIKDLLEILFNNNQVYESRYMDKNINNIAECSIRVENASSWKQFAKEGMNKKKPEQLNPEFGPDYEWVMENILKKADKLLSN